MTSAVVVSIAGEHTGKGKTVSAGTICKANWRHGGWDGHVYVRTIRDVVYWVAVLECTCGTTRTTKYTSDGTWAKVGSHVYVHPADYPKDMTQEECRITWLVSLMEDMEDPA